MLLAYENRNKNDDWSEMAERYTEKQPIEGECILQCFHVDKGSAISSHFYQENFEFRRPDGTEGTATWMVLCDDCDVLFSQGGLPPISGDGIWQGNQPFIEEVP